MSPVQKVFGFRGRIRRRDYWIYSILLGLFSLCVKAVCVLGFGLDRDDKNLSTALGLLLAWPNLAISVKRLHDRGRTGWLIIPFYAAPALIAEIGARLALTAPVTLLVNALLVVPMLWGLVEMGFRDTVPGPNRFGPSPKMWQPVAQLQLDNPALPDGNASA